MNTLILHAILPVLWTLFIVLGIIIYSRSTLKLQYRWLLLGGLVYLAIYLLLRITCHKLFSENLITYASMLEYPNGLLLLIAFHAVPFVILFSGIIMLMALFWKRIGSDAETALGIGLGLGLGSIFIYLYFALIQIYYLFSNCPGSKQMVEKFNESIANSPSLFLYKPIDNFFDTLCFSSIAILLILGIARKRRLMITGGLFQALYIGGINGYFFVCGYEGRMPPLMKLLFMSIVALASVIVIFYCYKRWHLKMLESNPATGVAEDKIPGG